MKNRQHFVPRFYLKAFTSDPRGSDPKRIHLFNLKKGIALQGVGLKGQCQRHRFYGADQVIENNLESVEGMLAPIIKEIINTKSLPDNGTIEHWQLLQFVAIQQSRTTQAVAEYLGWANGMREAMKEWANRKHPEFDVEEFLERELPIHADPVRATLSNAEIFAKALDDLRMHLVIIARDEPLITSDSPVFAYNTYNQHIEGIGVRGPASRGIQFFLPLTADLLLMLYDPTVYEAKRSRVSNVSTTSSHQDVRTFNMMQMIGAHENVYFNDWAYENDLRIMAPAVRRHRESMIIRHDEYEADGRDSEEPVILIYQQSPNLSVNLSFISVKKKARNAPDDARLKPRRNDLLSGRHRNDRTSAATTPRRFVRRGNG